MAERDPKEVDFGYQKVTWDEKPEKVAAVFRSVAPRYDVMNDFMSLGIHRAWKHYAIQKTGLRPGQKALDLAGGTGDLTHQLMKRVGSNGLVVLADINEAMLNAGREKLENLGHHHIQYVQADAETLPFASHTFDAMTIAFGLRNVRDQSSALSSMARVLRPGGKLVILEFSKPTFSLLGKVYDAYSFHVLPRLGRWVANDEDSYRYLAESIRMHPDQDTLKGMMERSGLVECGYQNLTGGIVALHWGYKA